MSAVYILWLRELKRYRRSPAQIVASFGQPLLYLLVLGFGLGPVFQQAGQGSYLQFVAPGVIGMSVADDRPRNGPVGIEIEVARRTVEPGIGGLDERRHISIVKPRRGVRCGL